MGHSEKHLESEAPSSRGSIVNHGTEANIMADTSDELPVMDPEKQEPLQKTSTAIMLDPSSFPDGGFEAWMVVFGGFCSLFVSFGWINCIGVFQTYYQETLLSSYSPSTVSWITSLETFVMFAGGPIFGTLYDNYGPRYIILAGSFLHVFGLMMASLSTEYYQFILAQGLLSPIGASAIFYPAMSSVGTWFFRNRALAYGVMASGSSLGGVIFPILVQQLIPKIGFPWTMRVAAFLILGMLVIANLTVKSRLPPRPRPVRIMNFVRPLTELPFLLTTVASFFIFFGIFLPFNYVILQAVYKGMSANLASYLLAVLNASSIFGRTIPGYIADRVGRYNVMIVTTFFSGITVLAIWLPSTSNAPIIVFSALYGFASGAFVSMAPAVIAQISDVREIGVRNGTLFFCVSVGALVGTPIGGALITQDNGGYKHLQIFSGTLLLAVTKYLFGDASKESIIEIPQGQLYLVRPLSPKGYSELIFKDAVASIRRTGQDFQYQLVIQRAYEEGEEELAADEDGDDSLAHSGLLGADKDEETFLLDQALHFRSEIREGGEKVFAWRDLSGDAGDLYEFVCDASIPVGEVATFEMVAIKCQYERKHRKPNESATEIDLEEFSFDQQPIPQARPTAGPTSRAIEGKAGSKQPLEGKSKQLVKQPSKSPTAAAKEETTTVAPPSAANPKSTEILTKQKAELHLFDFQSGSFILQDENVTATVSEIGRWQYWLQISSDSKDWLGQPIIADINPVFNFEYLSFIFNHYTSDGSAYSWLLRFKSQEVEERFQEGLMQALWEQLNETKWTKSKDDDRQYVLDAFQDLTMEDAEAAQQEEEEEEVEEIDNDGQRSEHYDSDEEDDDVRTHEEDGNVNSQLAVGYKHDRSFVVRGSKIGVFKHTPNNQLEFSTNISKVETPQGKLFSPKKVMLHAEDANMILQNESNPNSLYRMDLEYGKVVDEWKVHDDIPVTSFAPEKKFSQMTGEQTFLGLSRNALYRIDPRLAGNKLVDSELKQYVSKNDFSAAATTEKGYIAVASNKGDIRMFDRLGINAKTHIPALGEPIIGLDVSADGRWVLATCRTYLLLIDALQKDGKNEGKLGFEKSFAKDSKPQPRRLGLQPSHVAQFQHETKASLSFTPARFNTGVEGDKETSIITATGPFIVTWSMKKVLAGKKDPYTIKRYAEEVKADDFRFGSDKNVIVALPNEVNMVAKQSFKKPTRESIAGPAAGRRSTGGRLSSRLRREEVVESPY
ncbi:hypothetical protein MMC25_001397 [Agyrium rufum]|nr:hypothetical protein [Agyrium rufum]